MTRQITVAMCAGGRTLADPRVAPDGATVAFVASSGGGREIVLVPAGGGAEAITGTDPPPSGGWGVLDWLPSSDALVYVGADGLLYRQPAAGGPAHCLPGTAMASAPAVSPDGAAVAYVVDGHHVAVASLRPDHPGPVTVPAGADFCVDPAWSPDGALLAWHEWDVPAMAWDDSRIVVAGAVIAGISGISGRGTGCGGDGGGSRAPAAGPTAVVTPHPAAVGQPRFAPAGATLGFLCDGGGWLNVWSIDAVAGRAPEEGALAMVGEPCEHGGPTWGPGQRSWAWSPDGQAVAFTRNLAGFGELCVFSLRDRRAYCVDRGVFSGLSWAGERLVALRSGARTPDQIVCYEGPAGSPGTAGAATRTVLARGPVLGFEAAGLVEPETVRVTAAPVDGAGTEVHGRLYRSGCGPAAGGLAPLLVWVHGGPTGQHQVAFNRRAAYLLERGWNILEVDPRGSTGWGRAYTQALTGRWGRLDVDDTVAVIRAAAAEGWGVPGRIAIMGASSAGMTVLLVLARHPGLCAAGVDLYGVTDLVAFDENTHRFEAHYSSILLGTRPEAMSEWHDRSPITHVERITDPLLVLHGSADRVVECSQSQRLAAAVSAAGGVVELHVYDGEGHGWSRRDTVADELIRIDSFLTRHVLRGPPA